ncbi:MAG TPA: tetratricopeptide repeat protein [bacterium]|nr:tetratricopeptide repeat protein [bacterium]HPN42575.1 tetratricopeptide repeat protein [bacterium]
MKRTGINFLTQLVFYVFVCAILPGLSQQLDREKIPAERQASRMARQFELNGQYKEAADIYFNQSFNNPLDITSYAGAKRCLIKNNEINRLQTLILELQKHRRDIRYEIDLAEIEFLQGDKKKAQAHWQQILEENNVLIDAYILTGQAMIDNHLLQEAVDCYLMGRRKLKDQNQFIFELAGLYTAQSKYELMTLEYLRYLELNPNQVDFVDGRFIACEKDEGSSEQIAATLEKQVKTNKKLAQQLYQLLGNLYTRAKKYDQAFAHILALEEELWSINSKSSGLYLFRFAQITIQNNQVRYARSAFDTIINKYPKSGYVDKARIGLAQIMVQEGQYLPAVEVYENFVSSYPKSPESATALLLIGDLWFMQLFDVAKAEKAYQRLAGNYPWSAGVEEAIFKLADCAIINNNFSSAEKYYQRIIDRYNKKPALNVSRARYLLARLEFFKGFPGNSNRYLDECFASIVQKPGNADLYENDALELQMLLQEFKNDSTGLALYGHIQVLTMQRNYVIAESLLVNYISSNPGQLINNELAWLLAGVKREQGDYQAAIKELEGLYKNEQYMYRDKALKSIAEIYEQNLQLQQKALENYESLLALFPESIYIESVRKTIRSLEKSGEKNN